MANLGILKYCIEIPVFLLFFYFMISAPVSTNFVIYRTCYVSLGHNRSDCEKLGASNRDNATRELERLVQPHANIIMMTQSLLTQIVPAFLCLFIGPWSDKHGRKPVLISTIIGFVVGGLLSLVVVLTPSMSPWYLLIGCAPIVLFGGVSPLFMAALCYVTDVTTETNRGMRIGIFEGVMGGGMLLGTALSSYVFSFGGYLMVYLLGLVCLVVTLLYVIFVLAESVADTPDFEDDKAIFNCKDMKEMFATTFKQRANYDRAILLVLIVITTIASFASIADFSIFYQFVREKFGWDMQKYTLYKTVSTAVAIAGTFIGLGVLHKRLKITETPLIFTGLLIYFAASLIQGLATKDWHMYLAAGIRCFCGIVSPMCRSLISKLIFQEENGKVFSVVITLDALINLIGSPLYTLIYNATLATSPGIFNFVTGGLYGLTVILTITVIIMQNTRRNLPGYISLPINDED